MMSAPLSTAQRMPFATCSVNGTAAAAPKPTEMERRLASGATPIMPCPVGGAASAASEATRSHDFRRSRRAASVHPACPHRRRPCRRPRHRRTPRAPCRCRCRSRLSSPPLPRVVCHASRMRGTVEPILRCAGRVGGVVRDRRRRRRGPEEQHRRRDHHHGGGAAQRPTGCHAGDAAASRWAAPGSSHRHISGRPGRPRQRGITDGVHSRTGSERMPRECMQALHTRRHPSRRDAVDLGHLPNMRAVGEVGLMRGEVRRRRHLHRRPGALRAPASPGWPRGSTSRPWQPGASGSRTWGTVCRPGGAASSRPPWGLPQGAASGDAHHTPAGRTELGRDDGELGGRGSGGTAAWSPHQRRGAGREDARSGHSGSGRRRVAESRRDQGAQQLRHPVRRLLLERVAHGRLLTREHGRIEVVVDQIDDLARL